MSHLERIKEKMVESTCLDMIRLFKDETESPLF